MRDQEIRHALHSNILREFHSDPESHVFDEFSLCTGSTRVDIAVVNGALHGFEIKSDQDNLSRLPSQIELYSRVLDFSTLVVSKPHLNHARSILPKWWGIIVVSDGGNTTPRLIREKSGSKNPSPDPFSIAQLLWRQEALIILEAHGLAKGLSKQPRRIIWEVLAKNFPLDELGWLVRQAIKKRIGWRETITSDPSFNHVSGITIISKL